MQYNVEQTLRQCNDNTTLMEIKSPIKERKKDEKIYQIDELSNVDTTESINEDDEIW